MFQNFIPAVITVGFKTHPDVLYLVIDKCHKFGILTVEYKHINEELWTTYVPQH
jgi:hypothetical protein